MKLKITEWLISKTSKNHIYVSGPMTGYPELNRPTFNRVADKLLDYGYKVVNPAWLADGLWKHCLTRDIIVMLLFCNKLALLPGWRKSKGAQLEIAVAKRLGFRIYSYKYWLKRGRR